MNQPELYKLEGESRDLGKRSSDQLRETLKVPAVLYGPKIEENIHFAVSEIDLEKILSSSQTKLQLLNVNGKEYKTLLKNVEFDPVTDRALHADFYVLDADTPVKLKIPIRLKGIAKGVRDGGGRVFQPLRIVRIKVLPDRIPAQFELDITALNIGDSLHVSELDMEGIDPLDDPKRTIVTIAPPKSEKLFTSALEDDDEDLEESAEGEEAVAEGEEAAEGEETEETKE
ncbi:MAG: 50S ribosomal protein L25 [Balneolaceae bacterium]|nr:50S ribosomal protein L25 [Balneolaceae bacterium]